MWPGVGFRTAATALDMRMDPTAGVDRGQLVNELPEATLATSVPREW